MFVTKSPAALWLLVLTLSNLFSLGAPLHLSRHLGFDTYVSLLREAQEDIKNLANSLQEAITSALQEVENTEDLDEKIAIMEKVVAEQDEKIMEIEKSMFVPLDESQLSCPNYYEGQSEDIKKQTEDTKSALSSLPTTLEGLSDNQNI